VSSFVGLIGRESVRWAINDNVLHRLMIIEEEETWKTEKERPKRGQGQEKGGHLVLAGSSIDGY
jgi:hypothetical protein